MATLREWLAGTTDAGETLPEDKVRGYRDNHAKKQKQRETVQHGSQEVHWNPSMPSRGLGDTVAKVTHAIGLDVAAESIAKAVGKKSCGCAKKQARLNEWFPYNSEGEQRLGPSPS